MRGAALRRLCGRATVGAALLPICLGLAACGGSSGAASNATTSLSVARGSVGTAPTAKPTPGRGGGATANPHNHQPKLRTGASAFIQSGADNSIPEYGSEGSATQKAQATAALGAYLSARQAQEWGRACSLMGATVRRQLAVLAAASGGKTANANCVHSYRILSKYGSKGERADLLIGSLAAFRVKAEKGFALFYGPHRQQFMMPMVREGGRWKVSQSISIAYPIGAPLRAGH